jgi:hypothetical protein
LCQPPIPDVRDFGYRLSTPAISFPGAPTPIVEIFGDFQCPDTKALWEKIMHPLLAETDYVKGVSFIFHAFPLPYHRSGFTSAQAVRVVMRHLSSTIVPPGWLPEPVAFRRAADVFFSNQSKFQTDVTTGMSDSQIFKEIFAPIAASAGMQNSSEFLAGMADESINEGCRVTWKNGCTRGVYGTPSVAINGVVSAEASAWNLTQWRSWLNSQIATRQSGICTDTRCGGIAKECCEGSTALQKKAVCVSSVDCDSCCGWATNIKDGEIQTI